MSIVMRKKFSSKTKTYKQTLMSFKKLFFGEDILAHLSQRLKRAFLITICLFSVVVVLVVVVVVNFAHFHLLLQSHWTNLNQTWQKASLGEVILCSNERPNPFSRGDNRTFSISSIPLLLRRPCFYEIRQCFNFSLSTKWNLSILITLKFSWIKWTLRVDSAYTCLICNFYHRAPNVILSYLHSPLCVLWIVLQELL